MREIKIRRQKRSTLKHK